MKKVFGWLAAVAMLLNAASAVRAAPVVDYDLGRPGGLSPTGNVDYNGGATALIGSNITVFQIHGIATPLHAGEPAPPALSVTNGGVLPGTLAFATGNLTGSDATHWFFAGGGNITITGTALDVTGIPTAVATGVLLQGSFIGPVTVTASGGTFAIIGSAVFANPIPAGIASYFGLPSNVNYAGGFSLTAVSSASPPGEIHSNSFSGVGNIGVSPTPEPSSIALVGFGALGMLGYARRRRSMAKA